MTKSPILGGHGQARSLNLADNQCWNLYPSLVETKDGKAPGALYMTPGLDLFATVGSGPIRGLRVVNGVLYAVSGANVYRIFSPSDAKYIGTLSSGAGPVSIIDNGPFNQICFFDGIAGFIYNSKNLTFGALTPPVSGPVQATYQDTFGLVYSNFTQQWFQSNAGDLSTWNPLAFSSADGSSDVIIGIISLHREIWVMKQAHTEVWVDAGTTPFAFTRLDGVFLHHGCLAPFSVTISGEELIWLARTEQGQGRVVLAAGYQTRTISTVAMENELATYPVLYDAIAYAYEQEGENFYVLTFPTASATWVYSLRTNLWHRRGTFSNGRWSRHLSNCYANFNGGCIVGDYVSGNLYAFDLDNPYDNGAPRRWLRTWRALPQPVMKPQRFNYLQVDMETGLQVPQGTNPQVELRWSDDGGHNWSSQMFWNAGQTGQTAQRVKFNRLGSTKKNAGLDRIFELSSFDPFKVSIMGAEVG